MSYITISTGTMYISTNNNMKETHNIIALIAFTLLNGISYLFLLSTVTS